MSSPQTESDSPEPADQSPPSFHDLAPALEFMCWTALALIPFLRVVNGPAVTDDQFVVHCILIGTVSAGAILLRIYNWRTSV